MSSKIYVGNLPYSINDASLQHNFSEYGSVSSAKVMMDRDTGRSIVVNMARPKEDRGDAGGYRGGRSSY